MKKAVSLLAITYVCLLACSGCKSIKIEEAEREQLSYTVLQQEDVPQEIEALIEEKKTGTFQLTFKSGEELYLFKGYGQQMTGGYSIQVTDLSESENAVFFETKLIGPTDETIGGEPSYPYIGVKMAYINKTVQFR